MGAVSRVARRQHARVDQFQRWTCEQRSSGLGPDPDAAALSCVGRERSPTAVHDRSVRGQLLPFVVTLPMRNTLLVILALLVPLTATAQEIKVTLLGTGSPEPIVERFGPATLVEAGSEKLLFDAGRGVSQRLWQLQLPLRAVTA